MVLTRRETERVVIRTPEGREIAVELCDIKGDRARLGIDCAREITVHRAEVQAKIDAAEKGLGAA